MATAFKCAARNCETARIDGSVYCADHTRLDEARARRLANHNAEMGYDSDLAIIASNPAAGQFMSDDY